MTPSLFGLSFEDDCSCQFSAYCPLHIAAWPLLIALQNLYIECTDNEGPPSSEAIAKARDAIALATRRVTP